MNNVYFLEGYKVSYENAKSLFESAEMLALEKKYGIAISLLILSVEEGSKAISFLSSFLEGDNKIKSWPDIIDHKVKLDKIRGLLMHLEFIDIFVNEPIRHKEKLQKAESHEEVNIIRNEIFDKALFNLGEMADDKSRKWSKFNNWWKDANNQKKKGLYVDLNNNKFVSPSDVKKPKYDKTKTMVQLFFERIDQINTLDFEDTEQVQSIKNHLEKLNNNRS